MCPKTQDEPKVPAPDEVNQNGGSKMPQSRKAGVGQQRLLKVSNAEDDSTYVRHTKVPRHSGREGAQAHRLVVELSLDPQIPLEELT